MTSTPFQSVPIADVAADAADVPAPVVIEEHRPIGMAVVDHAPRTFNAFVPVLLLALIMLAYFTFQATQLRIERTTLQDMTTAQDQRLQDSQKLRDSLDAIARGTQRLADGGNPNARLIVDELKRRGVTIAPNPPSAAPTAPTK